LREHVTPATVGALIDEYFCTTVKDRAAERRDLCRVRLHPREAAMFDHCRETCLVDRDVEKAGDAAHLRGEVATQFLEM
jgi:hypothetical protein